MRRSPNVVSVGDEWYYGGRLRRVCAVLPEHVLVLSSGERAWAWPWTYTEAAEALDR